MLLPAEPRVSERAVAVAGYILLLSKVWTQREQANCDPREAAVEPL